MGVVNITQNGSAMDAFIHTCPAGRMLIIKKYVEDAGQSSSSFSSRLSLFSSFSSWSLSASHNRRARRQRMDEDLNKMMLDLLDDDDEGFFHVMFQYAIHIDKHLTRVSIGNLP